MTSAQWIVFGMLVVLLAVELLVQPVTRGYFQRAFNTLSPKNLVASTAKAAT